MLTKGGPGFASDVARLLTSSKEYMTGDPSAKGSAGRSLLVRLLDASDSGHLSSTRNDFVRTVLATAPATAYADPALRSAMAFALARQMNPYSYSTGFDQDFQNDVGRLSGLLAKQDTIPILAAVLLPETTPDELRGAVEAAGPEAAGSFGKLLGGNDDFVLELSKTFDTYNTTGIARTAPQESPVARILDALTAGPPSDARSSFAQNAFAATMVGDLREPALQSAMAKALAAEWHPDDADAASRDAERLTGIFATEQGRRLLASNGKNGPALETRVNALAVVRGDPTITGETLSQTKDAWTNPAFFMPIAQAGAQLYLDQRGDDPVTLTGSDLDNTVGVALGLTPTLPSGTDPAEAEAAVARGEFSYFASGDGAKQVEAVTDQIRAVAGDGPVKVTVLPILYTHEDAGPAQLPLFRVTDSAGAEHYVDDQGRRYDNFAAWTTQNTLPPGKQTYPVNGHLSKGSDGRVALEDGNTPRTIDSFGKGFLLGVDYTALGLGIVSAGLLTVLSDGAATPVLMAAATGAGLWGAGRATVEIVDRGKHGQTINPANSGKAFGLWLNLGANVAGICAFGSSLRVASLGRVGEGLSTAEAAVHGVTQLSAFGLDTAAMTVQSINTLQNWKSMSGGQRALSILQTCYWAAGAARSVGGTITSARMYNPVTMRAAAFERASVPITVDQTLSANAAHLDMDPVTRAVLGIRAGVNTSPEAIAPYADLVRGIQRANMLQIELAAMRSRYSSFDSLRYGETSASAGSIVGSEIDQISTDLHSRVQELNIVDLTTEQRTVLQEATAADNARLSELEQQVAGFAENPASIMAESQPGAATGAVSWAEREGEDGG